MLLERKDEKEWSFFKFGISHEIAKQMVEKGSIAIDGTSLTVCEAEPDYFTVALIPFTLEVTTLGPLVENASLFPQRTNVNFVQVLDRTHITMRTWERGCGPTLACGTGACSSVVACVLNGRTERKVTVSLQLGNLEIEWADDNHVYMTGPAATVFTGILTDPA